MNAIFADLQLLDLVGKLISCIVTVFIIFQYFDTRYERLLSLKPLYISWEIFCCLLNLLSYLFNNPFLNITLWVGVILITSKVFYYDDMLSKKRYYITNVVFLFVFSVCESVGGIVVEAGVRIMQIEIEKNTSVIGFVYTICGSISAMLLYYLVLKRLFIQKRADRIYFRQWAIYAIITAYALVNIGEILFLIRHEISAGDYLFLMADGVFIIIVNLYLFYLLDAFTENKDLKYKLLLYERQAKSNYEYYVKQMDNHKKALKVIHDVQKHMRIVDAYEKIGEKDKKKEYVDSFEEMIAPLLMFPYCENAILNIIINDKAEYCKEKDITFDVDIKEANIDFMKPIDITTIFGNLLDNAVEACEEAADKQMQLKICPFNGLVYVQLSNTYAGDIKWDRKGKPMSGKGGHHGIGLENVEQTLKNYHGSIQLSVQEQIFMTEVMFNKP